MGDRVRFDPDLLREIIWQGMTIEERINAQELEEDFYDDQYLIDEDFYEEGISCVLLLLVALAIFVNKGAGGEDG